MDALAIIAILLGVLGLVGSIIPGLPGPPASWIGMLLIFLSTGDMSTTRLFVWLAITVLVSILDYVVPAFFTKLTGGSKAASAGAIIGLFAGLFVPPVGMIIGSLLGAFIAEYIVSNKGAWSSIKASLGAFLGFLCGTGMKIVCSGVMMYYIIVAL